MSRPQEIVVVGGGIAGLTAAIALQRAGFAVTLLEAAPEFGEVGAGLTLSPNAMMAFDHIGLCEAVARAGVEPRRQRIQHWQDGRTLVDVRRADQRQRYGAPYVTIHRADLHAVLVDAARAAGVWLHTGAAVVATEGSTAVLHDGRRFSGSVLVGADGLKSVVRQRFEPGAAHFTGHVAWRAMVPVSAAVQDLADYPGMHIGPGRMVLRYVVRGGRMMNIVFFARQPGWTEEGWAIEADPAELSATYAGWSPEVARLIAAATASRLYKWAIHARRPLADWVADGCVALLGDAAHAMTPFLGQGAACGVEDAVVLARALRAAPTLAQGLRRYVEARHERATYMQAEAAANADRMQGQDTGLFGLETLRNEEALGLFDHDCRRVPV